MIFSPKLSAIPALSDGVSLSARKIPNNVSHDRMISLRVEFTTPGNSPLASCTLIAEHATPFIRVDTYNRGFTSFSSLSSL